MARYTTEDVCILVVHGSPNGCSRLSPDRIHFSRCDSVPEALRRVVHRVAHAERFEENGIDILIERRTGSLLNDLPHRDQTEIAIGERVAGSVRERRRVYGIEHARRRGAELVELPPGGKSRVVNHQVIQRDLFFAVLSELWDVLDD